MNNKGLKAFMVCAVLAAAIGIMNSCSEEKPAEEDSVPEPGSPYAGFSADMYKYLEEAFE